MADNNNNNAQQQQQPQPQQQQQQPQQQDLQPLLDQLVAQQAALQALTQSMTQAVTSTQQSMVQTNANMTQAINDLPAALGRSTTAPQFALSTAQADPGLIDFASKKGTYLEKACMDGLSSKFDGAPEHLSSFENDVAPMCQTMAWDKDICKITTQSGDTEYLLKKAAVLALPDIRASAEPYIIGSNKETRAAQNNKLAVDFLLNSITPSLQTLLNTEKDKFTFEVAADPAHPDDKREVKAFTLLWKVLIDRVTENCATKRREVENAIKDSSTYMTSQFHRDVPKYLEWFAALVIRLHDLNGEDKDLLKHFTNGLQESPCDLYNNWVATHFIAAENSDGYLPWGDKGAMIKVNYARFASKAVEQHRYLKSEGYWTNQSQTQQIVALRAEVETLQVRGGLRTNIPKSSFKPKKSPKSTKPAPAHQVKKNKKSNKDRTRQRFVEEWRKKPPTDGEPHTKIVDGQEEIWCIHHQLWQRHTSEACEKGKKEREATASAHKIKHVSHAACSYADAATAQATASLQAIADLSRST